MNRILKRHYSDTIMKHKVAAAPMLDVTDRYQRFIMRQISKEMMLYTEMIVANTLHYQTGIKRNSLLKYMYKQSETSSDVHKL